MKKPVTYMTIAVLLTIVSGASVRAHCQIPCGIYDDQMRIHLMEEHVVTIAKSMKQIESGSDQNQSIRWVLNKEKHADELSHIVTYYFMAQRIKPGAEKYEENLKTLHEILITTMKTKQSTNQAHIEKLNELIHAFEHSYLGEKHQH